MAADELKALAKLPEAINTMANEDRGRQPSTRPRTVRGKPPEGTGSLLEPPAKKESEPPWAANHSSTRSELSRVGPQTTPCYLLELPGLLRKPKGDQGAQQGLTETAH